MEDRTAHMPRIDNLYELPHDLPIPLDDGACNHLTGMPLLSCPSHQRRGVSWISPASSVTPWCMATHGRGDPIKIHLQAGMPFQGLGGARRNRAGFGIITKTCSGWGHGCSVSVRKIPTISARSSNGSPGLSSHPVQFLQHYPESTHP
jgi:hypothetical protein